MFGNVAWEVDKPKWTTSSGRLFGDVTWEENASNRAISVGSVLVREVKVWHISLTFLIGFTQLLMTFINYSAVRERTLVGARKTYFHHSLP
jgi:hypothetical protein